MNLPPDQVRAAVFTLEDVLATAGDGTGPRPRRGATALLERLAGAGVAIGVVSSSPGAAGLLADTELAGLVEARVDAEVAAAMALPGPPDPATLAEVVTRLGVAPGAAMVVQDSPAGVAAGIRGGFALVAGLTRGQPGGEEALWAAGAQLVATELGELRAVVSDRVLGTWQVAWDGEDDVGVRESLGTLGNGYFATRASDPWAVDDGLHYPGTYLAGLYNRLRSRVDGWEVEEESLVNAPNWLSLSFRVANGPWVGEDGVQVDHHRTRLDLWGGVLSRRWRVRDPAGHTTSVIERRLVSMDDPHLGAAQVSLVPEDWSGTLEVRSGLDARVADDETLEERLLAHAHLVVVDQGSDEAGCWVDARTNQSGVDIAMAARTVASGQVEGLRRWAGDRPGAPEQRFSVALSPGARLTLDKVVAVHTSRDRAIADPRRAARGGVGRAEGFAELAAAHAAAWQRLWRRARVRVEDDGTTASTLNLHLFHLLQVASPHVVDLDVGIAARGLHGEGYQGHIFWDEAFVFPVLDLRLPAVSRALLSYRHRRLPAARRAAAAAGHPGACYPWQSGSDGRDETPEVLYNPRSGGWMADRSRHQRHVGLAVARNAWQYWQVSGDRDFLVGPGTEITVEVARYFADLARFDPEAGRYSIDGVMGPDEFHDGYPWAEEPGVTDNAYTNVMTAWLLWRAQQLVEQVSAEPSADVVDRLGVDQAELARWDEISRGLQVPFHRGVISQFAGYERLAELDLDAYRARYGDVGRLDLILDAEGDTVRRYQVGKQPDVLMLFYLLSAEELRAVLARMGYHLSPETIRRTVGYYADRVTHGSTLSRVVHAWVLARRDRRRSWRYFREALASDVKDIQGGTTREGIHIGAMAGTVDLLQRCYAGLEARGEALWFNPVLPDELSGLSFDLVYRQHWLRVELGRRRLRVEARPSSAAPVTVVLVGEPAVLREGQAVEAEL
ncbi:MAG TPA: glycosyl hydrolase family 65 protein [Acidimicrobiales bacterium]|nr:glycosyl hydrolase family 65 protein [Acidimicrobiales bacterium]